MELAPFVLDLDIVRQILHRYRIFLVHLSFRIYLLPLGNAALATLAVFSGTEGINSGCFHMILTKCPMSLF